MMTNLNIRTDKQVKQDADRIFESLGLNMTTAINMFLKTVIREDGIPFDLKLRKGANPSTMKALSEADDMINNPDKYKWYDNVDELINDALI